VLPKYLELCYLHTRRLKQAEFNGGKINSMRALYSADVPKANIPKWYSDKVVTTDQLEFFRDVSRCTRSVTLLLYVIVMPCIYTYTWLA